MLKRLILTCLIILALLVLCAVVLYINNPSIFSSILGSSSDVPSIEDVSTDPVVESSMLRTAHTLSIDTTDSLGVTASEDFVDFDSTLASVDDVESDSEDDNEVDASETFDSVLNSIINSQNPDLSSFSEESSNIAGIGEIEWGDPDIDRSSPGVSPDYGDSFSNLLDSLTTSSNLNNLEIDQVPHETSGLSNDFIDPSSVHSSIVNEPFDNSSGSTMDGILGDNPGNSSVNSLDNSADSSGSPGDSSDTGNSMGTGSPSGDSTGNVNVLDGSSGTGNSLDSSLGDVNPTSNLLDTASTLDISGSNNSNDFTSIAPYPDSSSASLNNDNPPKLYDYRNTINYIPLFLYLFIGVKIIWNKRCYE